MLPDLITIISFIGAAVLLILMPGPDNLFVLTLGLHHNKKAAIAAALGLATGCLLHTAAVVLGIAALLRTQPHALLTIRWLGAAYLFYLAYQTYRHRLNSPTPALSQTQAMASASGWRWYRRGVVMNLLNPKVLLFFLAFLPQFVSLHANSPSKQLAILGTIFTLLTAAIFSTIGRIAGTLGEKLQRHPKAPYYLSWAMIAVFMLLALRLLWG